MCDNHDFEWFLLRLRVCFTCGYVRSFPHGFVCVLLAASCGLFCVFVYVLLADPFDLFPTVSCVLYSRLHEVFLLRLRVYYSRRAMSTLTKYASVFYPRHRAAFSCMIYSRLCLTFPHGFVCVLLATSCGLSLPDSCVLLAVSCDHFPAVSCAFYLRLRVVFILRLRVCSTHDFVWFSPETSCVFYLRPSPHDFVCVSLAASCGLFP